MRDRGETKSRKMLGKDERGLVSEINPSRTYFSSGQCIKGPTSQHCLPKHPNIHTHTHTHTHTQTISRQACVQMSANKQALKHAHTLTHTYEVVPPCVLVPGVCL